MSKMVFTIINRNKNNKLDIKKKYEVGSWVIGYWRPKKFFEINVWQVFEGRAIRLRNSVTDSKFENVNIPKSFIKIECEDAVEYLRKMREGSVDLMVTDPPHSDRIPYLELCQFDLLLPRISLNIYQVFFFFLRNWSRLIHFLNRNYILKMYSTFRRVQDMGCDHYEEDQLP